MIFRYFMIFAVLFSVTACAGKDKSASDSVQVGEYEDVSSMDGEGYAAGAVDFEGPVPGSQEDLVINVGDRVFFGYDRYDLTPDAQRILEMQAEWMRRYPNITVTVEGHCDERGTREYNLALGDRRANAVKGYLVALGVSPDRVQTISYGKEKPAVIGTGPAVWAQNRRGVTVVE